MSAAVAERTGTAAAGPMQLGLFAASTSTSSTVGRVVLATGAAAAESGEPVATTRPEPDAESDRSGVRRLAQGARGVWLARWSVRSGRYDNVVYVVARRGDGTMGCSCPGWIYHGRRPRCRHIVAVLQAEAGAASAIAAVFGTEPA